MFCHYLSVITGKKYIPFRIKIDEPIRYFLFWVSNEKERDLEENLLLPCTGSPSSNTFRRIRAIIKDRMLRFSH